MRLIARKIERFMKSHRMLSILWELARASSSEDASRCGTSLCRFVPSSWERFATPVLSNQVAVRRSIEHRVEKEKEMATNRQEM